MRQIDCVSASIVEKHIYRSKSNLMFVRMRKVYMYVWMWNILNLYIQNLSDPQENDASCSVSYSQYFD